jgi:tetratricopeptide (TPR) repeat protein
MATSENLPAFDKLWNYSKPAETEQKFRELLPIAESSGDQSYLAELLTQIGRTEGLQAKFDEAHDTLDRAESLLDETNDRARVRYLLERGRAFNSSGHPAEAMKFFEDAYALAAKAKANGLAIDAIHMIAIAQQDPNDQIEWNLKGIAAAEIDPDWNGWLAAFYNNIGESYAALHDYENAFLSFQKLNDFQRNQGKQPDIYSLKDEARMLRLLGKPREALEIIHPLFLRLEAKGTSDGWIAEELAESLHALGKEAEAKPHFATAFELLSQDSWCVTNEPTKIERLKLMAA